LQCDLAAKKIRAAASQRLIHDALVVAGHLDDTGDEKTSLTSQAAGACLAPRGHSDRAVT
jgi:hypothetical protein